MGVWYEYTKRDLAMYNWKIVPVVQGGVVGGLHCYIIDDVKTVLTCLNHSAVIARGWNADGGTVNGKALDYRARKVCGKSGEHYIVLADTFSMLHIAEAYVHQYL